MPININGTEFVQRTISDAINPAGQPHQAFAASLRPCAGLYPWRFCAALRALSCQRRSTCPIRCNLFASFCLAFQSVCHTLLRLAPAGTNCFRFRFYSLAQTTGNSSMNAGAAGSAITRSTGHNGLFLGGVGAKACLGTDRYRVPRLECGLIQNNRLNNRGETPIKKICYYFHSCLRTC